MRQGAKDQLGPAQHRVLSRHESDLASTDANGRAALFVRRCKGERELRMAEDECTELAAGVAAGAEHSDGDSIHLECIIMRSASVNP